MELFTSNNGNLMIHKATKVIKKKRISIIYVELIEAISFTVNVTILYILCVTKQKLHVKTIGKFFLD